MRILLYYACVVNSYIYIDIHPTPKGVGFSLIIAIQY